MMIRLHLTRALWAAAMAYVIGAMLPLGMDMIRITIRGYGPATEYLEWFVILLPKDLCTYAVLLLLLSVPMALLWNYAPSRRMLSVPWVAAICGAISGLLLSPGLYMAGRFVYGHFIHISVDDYTRHFHGYATLSVIMGALYFFLHSFFVRQALGKKAWLGTRA